MEITRALLLFLHVFRVKYYMKGDKHLSNIIWYTEGVTFLFNSPGPVSDKCWSYYRINYRKILIKKQFS